MSSGGPTPLMDIPKSRQKKTRDDEPSALKPSEFSFNSIGRGIGNIGETVVNTGANAVTSFADNPMGAMGQFTSNAFGLAGTFVTGFGGLVSTGMASMASALGLPTGAMLPIILGVVGAIILAILIPVIVKSVKKNKEKQEAVAQQQQQSEDLQKTLGNLVASWNPQPTAPAAAAAPALNQPTAPAVVYTAPAAVPTAAPAAVPAAPALNQPAAPAASTA